MIRKLTTALAVAALAAFGLAACGGDDDGGGGTSTAAAEATSTESGGGGSGGAGGTVEIAADPSDLAYTTTDVSTDAGSVTIDFDNPSGTSHDVRIEDADGNDIGGTDVISDSSTSATVDLEPGTYTFYCSVDGHRAAGMEGTLTVN